MAKDRCRFHADTPSIGSCRQCAIPLCQACAISKAEGIFCSGECYEKYTRFQANAEEYDARARRYRGQGRWKKWAVTAIVLVVVIILLHYAYDVNSPMDIPSAIGEIFSDIMGLF